MTVHFGLCPCASLPMRSDYSEPSSPTDLSAHWRNLSSKQLTAHALHFRDSCNRDVRSVGLCRISPSAPKKAAQTYCAQLTVTGVTAAAPIAGKLRAYCCHLQRSARREDDDGLSGSPGYVCGLAHNRGHERRQEILPEVQSDDHGAGGGDSNKS
jgi:hypothetical protein